MGVNKVAVNFPEQLSEQPQAEALSLQVSVDLSNHIVVLHVKEFLPTRDELDVVALFWRAHEEFERVFDWS